jgi:hypothetical protein
MNTNTTVVVTSIDGPNLALKALSSGCRRNDYSFIVIGDVLSPAGFQLDGCSFYDLKQQRETGFKFAELCPTKHYARKNVGYLVAARNGAATIVETDDDNIPREEFWLARQREQSVASLSGGGWVNVYRYFSEVNIWPRGFPLDHLKQELHPFESLPVQDLSCPIQQGLCDNDPDVDAIYRLVGSLPQSFRRDRRIALGPGSWCPFNSQNTSWWRDAFPLLYLPSHCSFRMTDIWRSFIAQRIAWANNWGVLFHEPTVWQERNEHNLMHNFRDEVPGYLYNREICEALENLSLQTGVERIDDNLRLCYGKLVSLGIMDPKELALLEAWLEDLLPIRSNAN